MNVLKNSLKKVVVMTFRSAGILQLVFFCSRIFAMVGNGDLPVPVAVDSSYKPFYATTDGLRFALVHAAQKKDFCEVVRLFDNYLYLKPSWRFEEPLAGVMRKRVSESAAAGDGEAVMALLRGRVAQRIGVQTLAMEALHTALRKQKTGLADYLMHSLPIDKSLEVCCEVSQDVLPKALFLCDHAGAQKQEMANKVLLRGASRGWLFWVEAVVKKYGKDCELDIEGAFMEARRHAIELTTRMGCERGRRYYEIIPACNECCKVMDFLETYRGMQLRSGTVLPAPKRQRRD